VALANARVSSLLILDCFSRSTFCFMKVRIMCDT
jgi:hypothetical protein